MRAARQLFSGYPRANIRCDTADFDGTNDVMTRGGALTGEANGKSGIFSGWIRLDGGNGAQQSVFQSLGASFAISRLSTNKFEVLGSNAGAVVIMSLQTTATFTSGAAWIHLLASWDLAVAGSGRLYINDVSDKSEVAYTNDTIRYAGTGNWSVGATPIPSVFMNGCIAELYFSPNSYLDFSLASNRRKFISAAGKPVHLGTSGQLPTGAAPLVYLHIDVAESVANFATNRSAGGNFTIAGGGLATGSTRPSD